MSAVAVLWVLSLSNHALINCELPCLLCRHSPAGLDPSLIRVEGNHGGFVDIGNTLLLIFYLVAGLFLLGRLLSGFFQVQTTEAAVIQRMGKFLRVGTAGINWQEC